MHALFDGTPQKFAPMQSVDKLLAGDTNGAVELFSSGQEPDLRVVQGAVKALRENEYPLAANALLALARDLSRERIIAWLSIPPEQRGPIDAYMLKRYHVSSQNRREMVEIAWTLYANPPQQAGLPAQAYFDFALWFGKDTQAVTFLTASRLYYDRHQDGALALVKWLAAQQPEDETVQRTAVNYLRLTLHASPAEIIAFYRHLFATGKEPYLREARLDYLEDLASKRLAPEDESLATLEQGADALRAAEAFLVEGQYTAAAERYRAVLDDPAAEIGRRAAAWAGLLDSDPAAALDAAGPLLDAVAKMDDQPARAGLVTWLGGQLARVAGREVPLPEGQSRMATRKAYRPVHDVPQWQTRLVAVMTRLLDIDTVACLRPGTNGDPSLRYTAALLDALTGDVDGAYQVAKRPITYLQSPPPGGWTIFPGTPDKDAEKPRERQSPANLQDEINGRVGYDVKRVLDALQVQLRPDEFERVLGIISKLVEPQQ